MNDQDKQKLQIEGPPHQYMMMMMKMMLTTSKDQLARREMPWNEEHPHSES